MKTIVSAILAILAVTCTAAAISAARPAAAAGPAAQGVEIERLEAAAEAVRDLVELPEKGIPEALLKEIQGMAILPGVLQAAYGVGGQYGRGVLLVRGETGEWSRPCFIRLYGGSIGWQIGVQRSDIVLVFKTPESVREICEGKLTLGADAAVAAGPVGRRAEASTDAELEAEIYSYSRTKGLFAGIAIKGGTIQMDEEANEGFYGRTDLTARDILEGRDIEAPPAAAKLQALIAELTGK